MSLTLAKLRRDAIARSLFAPRPLADAIDRLGFVQADPLRAPARAQDLTLRHRVPDYCAGDLDAAYPALHAAGRVDEDFFVNYGFLPSCHLALMHPRTARLAWSKARWRQAHEVLAFVRARGEAHPREVDAHFAHGRVVNWFGGNSRASTELLDGMHYRGLLRVARRDAGTRVYAAREPWTCAPDRAAARERMDRLVDLVVAKYAPLPAASLAQLMLLLRGGAPQWAADRVAALARAKARLPHARVDGVDWYWPSDAPPQPDAPEAPDRAWLLAPFDPVVWDRRRFELFWGWPYRFEAYTPAPKRQLGHYALPLLWRDRIVGWANVAVRGARMHPSIGFAGGMPADAGFKAAVDDELHRLHRFLGLS
jgi:uncharacterized protein YcaQ